MTRSAKLALAGCGVALALYFANQNEAPPTPPLAEPDPTQAAAAPNPHTPLPTRRLSAGDRDAVERAFDAFCGLNLRYVEAMFDAVPTTCRVVAYHKSAMILFMAEGPVFSVPAARKAWAAAVALSAGKTIRDLGGSLIGVDYVGLTDSEQVKVGKIARFPASFAEHLQAAIHDGKVDALVAVGNLDKRLVRTLALEK